MADLLGDVAPGYARLSRRKRSRSGGEQIRGLRWPLGSGRREAERRGLGQHGRRRGVNGGAEVLGLRARDTPDPSRPTTAPALSLMPLPPSDRNTVESRRPMQHRDLASDPSQSF